MKAGGVGFSGLLFLVFLVLKLTGVIDWSWWLVTSPLWITAALVVVITLIAIIVVTISAMHARE